MVVIVVMISMMVMNKMTLSLAQDEEELTATMIRFVEDPEDRTKQARKVIIIITIFTINTTIDAKGGCKKKTFFFGYLSQMWVGGVADSQTRFKTLKKNQITPKIAFFDPNFTFRFPKSHKTLRWVGG